MDDALVQNVVDNIRKDNTVLILVLMDDALVLTSVLSFKAAKDAES